MSTIKRVFLNIKWQYGWQVSSLHTCWYDVKKLGPHRGLSQPGSRRHHSPADCSWASFTLSERTHYMNVKIIREGKHGLLELLINTRDVSACTGVKWGGGPLCQESHQIKVLNNRNNIYIVINITCKNIHSSWVSMAMNSKYFLGILYGGKGQISKNTFCIEVFKSCNIFYCYI